MLLKLTCNNGFPYRHAPLTLLSDVIDFYPNTDMSFQKEIRLLRLTIQHKVCVLHKNVFLTQ